MKSNWFSSAKMKKDSELTEKEDNSNRLRNYSNKKKNRNEKGFKN